MEHTEYGCFRKRTHVFVCLGSNELYTADMKGCEKRIRAILSKIGNIPTACIGHRVCKYKIVCFLYPVNPEERSES